MRVFAFLLALLVTATPAAARQEAAEPPAEAPEVAALLERVKAAYAGLESLKLEATVAGEYDAAGRQARHEVTFTSLLAADGRFRHEVPGEVTVAADAEATYVYLPASLRYYRTVHQAAPAEGRPRPEVPLAARRVLLDHNPSLLLALVEDAARELRAWGALSGDGERALRQEREDGSVWYFRFDESHLLREVKVDESAALERSGVPDVVAAGRTITYTAVEPGAAVPEEAVAFRPPDNAQEVERTSLAGAASLVGQPAPALSLPDVEGTAVSLEQLRGRVVVVDFWASWCGPCVMGMPHLLEIAREHAAEGLSVLLVNLAEEERVVRQFIADQQLAADGLRVLRDHDGSTAERWGVSGIPHTVVIGRDGRVREVIVGLSPEKLTAAVKAAMEER